MNLKKLLTLLTSIALICSLMTAACADETVNVIMQTGTTQAFTADTVAEADLKVILQAGLHATSAINQQPWYFVAVTNQEIMKELSGGMGFGGMSFDGKAPEGMPAGDFTPPEGGETPASMPPVGEMPAAPAAGGAAKAAMGDSPAAIIIYMNENTASPDPSFDCGLACQNMVIAASALGYGTKIISSPTMTLNGTEHDALCEKLGVDPALNAVAVLLLGKTDTAADATSGASVRSTIEEKVSFVD